MANKGILNWSVGNTPGAPEDATAPSAKVPGGLWSVGEDGSGVLFVEGNEAANVYLPAAGSAAGAKRNAERYEAAL